LLQIYGFGGINAEYLEHLFSEKPQSTSNGLGLYYDVQIFLFNKGTLTGSTPSKWHPKKISKNPFAGSIVRLGRQLSLTLGHLSPL
jgi:hypothetical protein